MNPEAHLVASNSFIFQIDSKSPQDFKKQLKIQFVGEEGVDEGGVQKEFFQLMIRELFDEKYGWSWVESERNCYLQAYSG